jgi:signal transduction histidine kinase
VRNHLRAFWDEPRATPPPPRRVWGDWVLLAAVVVGALLEVALRDDMDQRILGPVMVVALAPTLLWRRTHPLAVVVAAFGASAAVDAVLLAIDAPPTEMYSQLYFLLLPYALVRWGSGRDVVAGTVVIAIAAGLGTAIGWAGFGDLFGGTAVLVTAMVLGRLARTQHGVRERRLEQAKAEERVQIARELHDTVAHHVSAIAIQAQAGRALAATTPTAPAEALEVIEAEASRTLAELRAMVRMLRNRESAEYAPQSGVADLGRLAVRSPTGPRVDVSLTGDVDRLSPAVDAAVFRIAREAVTNALRHARNANRVDVRVEVNGSTVHLQVRDDGDPVSLAAYDPGFGVTGMAERAALLGGTCLAGPAPDRGWSVDATLPREVRR